MTFLRVLMIFILWQSGVALAQNSGMGRATSNDIYATESAACDSALNSARQNAMQQARAAMVTPVITNEKCECRQNESRTKWSCVAWVNWEKGK